ncbi:hypothetical protein MMC14_002269 [Varicellaria rhodocarpa]|nr:hypothetical protein [Varicellaria rhodocarpa]
MASSLPPFPRFVFTILEPISEIAGFLTALFRTPYFISAQYQHTSSSPLSSSPNAQLLALQLGNAYLLLALVGIAILQTTRDEKVVRAYLVALAVADVGHVAPTMWVMGWERVVDVQGWNAMAWGNIGATIFLFGTRVAYFMGWFGRGGGKVMGKEKGL